jgi:arginine/serine-rich splicing factor 7
MSRSSSSESSYIKANRRIYVTGYSYKEDQHDMKKIFKKYGHIEDFSWKGKYFFVVRGGMACKADLFCFKAYSDKDEAKKAVRKMNKEDLNGYTLIVEFAKHKNINDRACYNCGKKGHL